MTRPIVRPPSIPRCPPPGSLLLSGFRQELGTMDTPKLQALVRSLVAQVKDAAGTKEGMVLREKLQLARKELQSRQGPADSKYQAQLRKMSDQELRGEFVRAARSLWVAEHGFIPHPKQVEAAQHRLDLVRAELARRDLPIPRFSPFIGPHPIR